MADTESPYIGGQVSNGGGSIVQQQETELTQVTDANAEVLETTWEKMRAWLRTVWRRVRIFRSFGT